MALAFATRPLRESWTPGGGKRTKITRITLDALYVNGTGWAITKQQLGFGANDTLDSVRIVDPPHAAFVFTIAKTATGITLRAWTGALAEAATNLAGLNGVVVALEVTGN